ncbi:hypothetical protein H4219_004496 [Mycoemilia scoparia]|uniref:Protein arginine N-methyltransferase n=1 Tax=Mycoemilia scoparia TaxID=417184 RepID=A0A9W7ZX88_9FUNG|nr:hypothetical protein H4219_004496 [Mycoemilia scoparia]
MTYDKLSIGVEPLGDISDLDTYYENIDQDLCQDFVILPVINGSPEKSSLIYDPNTPFSLKDTVFKTSKNTYRVIAGLGNLKGDGKDWSYEMVERNSAWIKKQLTYVSYQGCTGVLLPEIESYSGSIVSLGQLVLLVLSDAELMVEILIRVRVAGTEEDIEKKWQLWHRVRTVFLEVEDVDLENIDMWSRWFAEPVACLSIPTTLFLQNSNGYPVLRPTVQRLLQQWMDYNVAIIVSEKKENTCQTNNAQLSDYVKYVRHLHHKLPKKSQDEILANTHRDYLQAPLQPLMNNLGSVTYEVFEQDSHKYIQYEEVWLEKNNAEIWGNQVKLVYADMREWSPPEKAHILASELLGSFGDNELSPECLDGAQSCLRSDGVCIPQEYTSYIAPISSSKLYSSIEAHGSEKYAETPYVVRFHEANRVAPTKSAWSFSHPISPDILEKSKREGSPNKHNQRHCSVNFSTSKSAVIHGIAGYFESSLYKDVRISIVPETHSCGMFSWFPIYFPLKTPLSIVPGSKVVVSIWRRSSNAKVWHEWLVEVFSNPVSKQGDGHPGLLISSSGIHNVGGSSFWIGL